MKKPKPETDLAAVAEVLQALLKQRIPWTKPNAGVLPSTMIALGVHAPAVAVVKLAKTEAGKWSYGYRAGIMGETPNSGLSEYQADVLSVCETREEAVRAAVADILIALRRHAAHSKAAVAIAAVESIEKALAPKHATAPAANAPIVFGVSDPAIPAIPAVKFVKTETAEEIVWVGVDQISPDTNQHRTTFDIDYLEGLGKSIKTQGQDSAVILRHRDPSIDLGVKTPYVLIAGECRWRGVQLVGISKLKSIVKPPGITGLEIARIQSAENLQRRDLNCLEQARAFKRLLDSGEKPETVWKQYGLSKASLYGKLKLLELPEPARKAIAAGQLGESIATDLARLDASVQTSALETLLQSDVVGLSYREQSAKLKAVASEAKAIETWEAIAQGYRDQGYGFVMTYGESKRSYITEKWVGDHGAAKQKVESPVALGSKCYEDPKQRTYADILGNKLLQTTAVKATIAVGRSQENGHAVRFMGLLALDALLLAASFDRLAAKKQRDGTDDVDIAARQREHEINEQVAKESRMAVVAKIQCTGLMVWKVIIRQMIDNAGGIDNLEEAIAHFLPKLDLAEFDEADEAESFRILWQFIPTLPNDDIAKFVAFASLKQLFRSHWPEEQQANAAVFDIDYAAIRERIAGPVKKALKKAA